MTLQEEYFDSFTKEHFEILFNCLHTQGYVIDGKLENGITFLSTHIENMSKDMFDNLCLKYNFENNINISKIGHYYPKYGANYIVFNAEYYDHAQARKIMDNYLLKRSVRKSTE